MSSVATMPGYAEIGITTNFSFLRGGSDPRAYVHQASKLRIPAIGIADHNTLAGVVRAYKSSTIEVKQAKLLIGASRLYRRHPIFWPIRATAPLRPSVPAADPRQARQ